MVWLVLVVVETGRRVMPRCQDNGTLGDVPGGGWLPPSPSHSFGSNLFLFPRPRLLSLYTFQLIYHEIQSRKISTLISAQSPNCQARKSLLFAVHESHSKRRLLPLDCETLLSTGHRATDLRFWERTSLD